MNVRVLTSLLVLTLACHQPAQAQRPDPKTEQEVRTRAGKVIEDFAMKLNLLSNLNTPNEKKLFILKNSYKPASPERIFLNDKVLIDDDTDPTFFTHTCAVNRNPESYLSNFSILYTPSAVNSVAFTNVKPGPVKALNDKEALINVYFESLFANPSIFAREPYRKTQRVAEVKALKVNGQWQAFIGRILFFHPAHVGEFFPAGTSFEQVALNKPPAPPQPPKVEEPAGTFRIVTKKAYTRGRTYNVSLEGSAPQRVTLHLYNGETKDDAVFASTNDGKVSFTVPKKLKPGAAYTLRTAAGTDPGSTPVGSAAFRVKRKIPLFLKPLAAVTTGVVLYLLLKKEPPPPPPPPPVGLPDPGVPR